MEALKTTVCTNGQSKGLVMQLTARVSDISRRREAAKFR